MPSSLHFGDLAIELVRRDIRCLRLGVHPPDGRVRIAAPRHMSIEAIRAFVVRRLEWIHRKRQLMRERPREQPREYVDRERHDVWGEPCLLNVIERDGPPSVAWQPPHLLLSMRPGSDVARKAAFVEAWYREQLHAAAVPLVAQWERHLGVSVQQLSVRRMKTRWGSCSPHRRSIRLNTELARKPRDCLEYLIVHEMVHLLEPSHNTRFVALMDRFLPEWRQRRALLDRRPLLHTESNLAGIDIDPRQAQRRPEQADSQQAAGNGGNRGGMTRA